MMRRLVSVGALALGLAGLSCGLGEESDEGTGSVQQAEHQFCGGIAAFPCPDGYVCLDDPRDDCDPTKGGADCGGWCRKAKKPHKKQCELPGLNYIGNSPAECSVIRFFCAEGVPFSNECGCGCDTGSAPASSRPDNGQPTCNPCSF